jgi:hypothetical protein
MQAVKDGFRSNTKAISNIMPLPILGLSGRASVYLVEEGEC